MTTPLAVGVVGCGNISSAYLRNMARMPAVRVAACADLDAARAAAQAAQFNVPRACTPDELLADSDIAIVVNLTTPQSHHAVALAALRAGKSVYNEKPLTLTRAEAQELLAEAAARGLRVGCAPDTFLGAGLQTARALLDEGVIGAPIAATAFMACHGHESWHPDPAFYYRRGGGPLLDMGPYYLTALAHLLGPFHRAAAVGRITFPTRTVTSAPRRGEVVTVETPTHISGSLECESGAIVTLIMSFDVWHTHLPLLEVHGTEGSMSVPDPNGFGGILGLRAAAGHEWRELPPRFPNAEESRGLGVADLASALCTGRPHRASGELAAHVLDAMHALLESAETGRHVPLTTTCPRPAALPPGLPPGHVD